MTGRVRSRSLTPRAVRVRNAWLRQLAGKVGAPKPDDAELAVLGKELSLRDAFRQLVQSGLVAVTGERRWRRLGRALDSRRARLGTLAASSAVLLVLTLIPTRANEIAGEVGAPRVAAKEMPWINVTDSIVAAVHERLLLVGQADVRFPVRLNSAELAALVLGPNRADARKKGVMLGSIEARTQGALELRGSLRGGGVLVMQGRLHVPRPGVGELRLSAVSVDGAPISRARLSRALSGRPVVLRFADRRPPTADLVTARDSARVRFELPMFVRTLRVERGRAWAMPEVPGRSRQVAAGR